LHEKLTESTAYPKAEALDSNNHKKNKVFFPVLYFYRQYKVYSTAGEKIMMFQKKILVKAIAIVLATPLTVCAANEPVCIGNFFEQGEEVPDVTPPTVRMITNQMLQLKAGESLVVSLDYTTDGDEPSLFSCVDQGELLAETADFSQLKYTAPAYIKETQIIRWGVQISDNLGYVGGDSLLLRLLKSPATEGNYSAEGYAQDEYGNPLAGILLEIDGKTVVTDENGYYQIDGLEEGTYTLIASKEGYQFEPMTFTVDADNPEVTLPALTAINIHEPRIVIAKEKGDKEILITDAGGEILNRIPTKGFHDKEINVATGDFDADGSDDIVVSAKQDVAIFTIDGEPTEYAFSIKKHKEKEGDVAVGDINGDGEPEIVLAAKKGHDGSVIIYSKDGTLLDTVQLFDKEKDINVAVADVDGDGVDDIIGGNSHKTDDNVVVYNVASETSFSFPVFDTVCDYPGEGSPKYCDDDDNKSDDDDKSSGKTRRDNDDDKSGKKSKDDDDKSGKKSKNDDDKSGKKSKDDDDKSGKKSKDDDDKSGKKSKDDDDDKSSGKKSKDKKPKKTDKHGVNVAAGNLVGDDTAEIVVAMAKKGSRVEIYSGDGQLINGFYAFENNKEGVIITVGDINGDGLAEIVVAAAKKGSEIRIFDANGNLLDSFSVADKKGKKDKGKIVSLAVGKTASENPTVTPEDVTITDETPDEPQPPESPEDGSQGAVESMPSIIVMPTSGELNTSHNYGGETLTDVTIKENVSISNAKLAGDNLNEGFLSNSTVLEGATLEGGTVTGDLDNEGIVRNIIFVGRKLEGGFLGGMIIIRANIAARLGIVMNVTLENNTRVKGGRFKGKIKGNGFAQIEEATIDANTELSNLIIGEGCDVSKDAILGEDVQFAKDDLIPEDIDLTAASSSADGVIDLSTDVVLDAPNPLDQINDLPEMQDNNWELVQNPDNGQLEVTVESIRFVVKPKRIKQGKRNRRAQIIGHGQGQVTVITPLKREISFQLEIAE